MPEYIKNDKYFAALANNIIRRYGPIDWSLTGPKVDGRDISLRFMYPPIIGIDDEIDRLNDPKKDTKVLCLSVEDIESILETTTNTEIEAKLRAALQEK